MKTFSLTSLFTKQYSVLRPPFQPQQAKWLVSRLQTGSDTLSKLYCKCNLTHFYTYFLNLDINNNMTTYHILVVPIRFLTFKVFNNTCMCHTIELSPCWIKRQYRNGYWRWQYCFCGLDLVFLVTGGNIRKITFYKR